MKVRCDFDHALEVKIVGGELNLTTITPDGESKTVPITTKSNLDELLFILNEMRTDIVRD